jgi:hypothetical protein
VPIFRAGEDANGDKAGDHLCGTYRADRRDLVQSCERMIGMPRPNCLIVENLKMIS